MFDRQSVWHDVLVFNFALGRANLDSVTLIRIISGILAVVVFVILLFRMKKKAPR